MSENSSQSMPAVIGLAGVIVGALITGGANFVLVVKQEQLAQVKYQRDKDAELREASRLMFEDISYAKIGIESGLRSKKINRYAYDYLQLPRWNEHRSTITRDMNTHDWNLVTTARIHVGIARMSCETRKIHPDLSEQLDEVELKTWSDTLPQIEEGIQVLKRLSYHDPPN